MSQPPQAIYDTKAAIESILHRQRRKGEDTGEARLLLGAVTTFLGAYMLFGEYERRCCKPFGREIGR